MNHYRKAMEIIEGDHDWRQIVVEIAKRNPSKVVNAVYVLKNPENANNDELILKDCKINKIQGIKKCRELMKIGLKETKDYCDELMVKSRI